MRKQDNYAIMSVRELANYIVSQIDLGNVLRKPFPECDFTIIDPDVADMVDDIEYYGMNEASGWYGIKRVEIGFESTDLILMSDYYGGGAAEMVTLWEDMAAYDCDPVETVMMCLLSTLNIRETTDGKSMLVVEFVGDGVH